MLQKVPYNLLNINNGLTNFGYEIPRGEIRSDK